ncbi:glycosyltransferase family 2 protein [Methylomonas albis]|nr:glycosyltransferase family 2 protein [Methylomonas albis]
MNQIDPPTVSVCIPTFRGEAHIGAAIESVLNQSFTNYELIVIDDNSPDKTWQIVSSYQDERIKYIKNSENLGPEGNWNKCLAEAKGKYLKLLPHDDTLAADCLRQQVEVLDEDVKEIIALVFCARHIVDCNEKTIATRGYRGGRQGVVSGGDTIKKCVRLGTNLIGEPGAVLFRKSLADKVGPFDGGISYIIDLDYWFRLLLHGDAYYIDKPLASFRVAAGSWSIDIGSRQSQDFIGFINRCIQNPVYRISPLDCMFGRFMAKINNYLRLLFYKYYLPH